MARALLMQKKGTEEKPTLLAEVFVSSSDSTKAVGRAVLSGEARKIGPRLYTTNQTDAPEDIIRRNRWRIVSLLAPGSVIAFRTALEMVPAPDGTIFLSGAGRHTIDLPGLHLRIVKGPGSLPGDQPFMQDLHIASQGRALLESLRPSRERSTLSRGLPRARIEEILERELQSGGEAKLNRIRDIARALVSNLNAQKEFEVLTTMIGTLLGSRKGTLVAPVALARAAGEPYDSSRLDTFQTLHSALTRWPVVSRPDAPPNDFEFSIISFFDAYFSNFIEGTEFEVDEAHEIVFEGKIPEARPQDAHDVLGTFRLVGSREFVGRSILDFPAYGAFESALLEAHASVMAVRPEKRPGEFKKVPNVAGQTIFVAPELIRGTLRHGFEIIRGLAEPFLRAAAIMFVLSEIHPFDDGNGRIARAFMNAELISGRQRRILIPSVIRDEYLTGLRTLTRQGHPDPFLKVLDYAQMYTALVDFSDYDGATIAMRATNAFENPSQHMKLRLPRDVNRGGH